MAQKNPVLSIYILLSFIIPRLRYWQNLSQSITIQLKMPNRRSLNTTTRVPNNPLPMFNLDDILHTGTPNPTLDRPSSIRPELR